MLYKSRLNTAITCIHPELIVTGKLILKPVGTTRVALETASHERDYVYHSLVNVRVDLQVWVIHRNQKNFLQMFLVIRCTPEQHLCEIASQMFFRTPKH